MEERSLTGALASLALPHILASARTVAHLPSWQMCTLPLNTGHMRVIGGVIYVHAVWGIVVRDLNGRACHLWGRRS